jgi:pyridoxamine 5'-phosphate oxidase
MADAPLREADFAADPFAQFDAWFAEASSALRQPEAIALATADDDGAPSVRMVLLKAWDERGFVFFTNYASRKGGELAANPRGALVVYWEPLGRQVRAEGAVERTSEEESDAYFASRPRLSQIAAHASHQSRPLADRTEIDLAFGRLEQRFADRDVPRPEDWGGFRLVPSAVEFWQHQENRLHDRLVYRRNGDRWRLERLAP